VAEPLTLFDEKQELVPWLVTSWVLDPDAKTMTFKVRQGVKFHDGTDFNAEAVKWNWEQAISWGRITGGSDLKSIDVVDPYTVRLTFNKFSAMYIFSFTHTCPQFSPTAVQKNGKEWARTHAVGTGPFKQADFKPDSYLKLDRFDGYWGTRSYLDGITFTVVSDATVAGLMFRKKDADMWDPANLMEAMYLREEGYQVIQRRALVTFLAGDSANPKSIFANKKVREALEYALDRDAIAAVRGYGYAYEPV
jgi:ABC-type transport system substrate-binding protein